MEHPNNEHPAKRRAVEENGAPHWRAPQPPMEDQLRGKDNEELAEIIGEMQANFDNKIAEVNARLNAMNEQMQNMVRCMGAFFHHQTAAISSATQFLDASQGATANRVEAPIASNYAPKPEPPPYNSQGPHPPHIRGGAPNFSTSAMAPIHEPSTGGTLNHAPPSTAAPPPRFAEKRVYTPAKPPAGVPNPPTTTSGFSPAPTPSPAIAPASSPMPTPETASSWNNTQAPKLKIIPSETAGEPPTVIYGNANDVETVWREFRYGIDGQPSLESIDVEWGSRWRPDPRGRTWYSRRKLIQDKIKELLHDGISEEAAITELERLRAGRSMNSLMNLLQLDRKETKKNWKAAATAAKAASDATRGRTGTQGVLVPPSPGQSAPPPPSQF